MGKLLSGREVVTALNEKLAKEAEKLKAKGTIPTLAIVRVGERKDDVSYERGAAKRCAATGVEVRNFVLPAKAAEQELIKVLEKINADEGIHGCLLFRPLPNTMDDRRVCNTLIPEKDVDGITDASMAGVYSGSHMGFPPCTPSACMEILDYYGIDCTGKKAVVIGRSLVVDRYPAALAPSPPPFSSCIRFRRQKGRWYEYAYPRRIRGKLYRVRRKKNQNAGIQAFPARGVGRTADRSWR